MQGPCHSFPSPSHCGKCGRRSRQTNPFRCKREHHLLSPTIPPYPAISQNTSCPSGRSDVLIDQFIQVQQIDPRKCLSPYHKTKDECRTATNNERERFHRWQHVRQMIYLRENINNSSFRLIPFPSQYVLVKRVEESNHLRQKNRIKVDHLFRPFEMQYQTMSQEMKHLIIPTTRYVREEATAMASAPLPNPSMNNNHSQTPTILLSWLQNTTDLNQQSLTSDSLQRTSSEISYRELRTSDRTAPFEQTAAKTSSSTSSSSSVATTTSHTKKQIALKYAETFDKMKRLLELLRLHLTNKSNMMKTMALDSLQSTSSVHSTYSVSSTLPISFENRLPDRHKSSSSSQSTINVEDEITPIDELVPFRRHGSEIRIRNTAQNINHNQKNIDDDLHEDMEETTRISIPSPVQYMPSSFMFILQLLLLSCLLHRLISPSDLNVLDLMLKNVSSSVITETETHGSSSQTLWKHVLLSVFHH